MNFEMYLHKIEHFINARAEMKSFGEYVYVQDEPNLFPVFFKKENGKLAELSHWQTCFPKGMPLRALKGLGLSEDESYAFEVFLSRLGYLFQIDNRQRIDKDIFIFFYIYQLVSLKNNNEDYAIKAKNFFLRFLCFEMGMDYDAYDKLCVTSDGFCINTTRNDNVPVLPLIEHFYELVAKEKNYGDIKLIKNYQISVLNFLFIEDGRDNYLHFNDTNCYLSDPNGFVYTYKKSQKTIYKALGQCFDKYQSTGNLLISNFILMNYSYYIIRDNPADLKFLRKNVPSEVFQKIISAIIYRGFFVDEDEIFKLIGEEYRVIPKRDEGMFFNLIYSI